MQYKTIVQELIEQNPTLFEALKSKRLMLTAIDVYARKLRANHLELTQSMDRQAAFEVALHEMEDHLLPSETPFDLDEAMAFIRSQTA